MREQLATFVLNEFGEARWEEVLASGAIAPESAAPQDPWVLDAAQSIATTRYASPSRR